MPIYEYHCEECDHNFDVHHSGSTNGWRKCPLCKGKAMKVFHPPSLIFKGSGFHVTDYSSSSKSNGPARKKETPEKATPASDKTASKPAK